MTARNTGWQAARGEWIVGLDSDDELVDQALGVIHRRLAQTPREVMFALFHCRLDGGEISPDPPLNAPSLLDYEAYLKSLEAHFNRRYDTLHCMRIGVELDPAGVREDLFCFDLHKQWKSAVYPEVVLLYHQDSGNQLSDVIADSPQDNLAFTQAQITGLESLLASHGNALKQIAPRWYHRYACNLATLQFALGRRRQGVKYSAEAIRIRPTNPRSWIVPLLGVCGGNVLVRFRAAKRLLRRIYAVSAGRLTPPPEPRQSVA